MVRSVIKPNQARASGPQTREQKMTKDQLQDALNTAYFAFAANPSDKSLAAAYDAARDALFNALINSEA